MKIPYLTLCILLASHASLLASGLPCEPRNHPKDQHNTQTMQDNREERRKALIQQCRYYDREYDPEALDDTSMTIAAYWEYEEKWVEWTLEGDPMIQELEEWVQMYQLESRDGDKTPLTLKALLLNRFLHWGFYGPPEEELKQFEEWYTQGYLQSKTNAEREAE